MEPATLPRRDPAARAAGADLRQLLLNVLALFGAYVLPRLCTFAAAVVAARVLGVAVFGVYGAAAGLAVILSLVATLGMMQLLVRELAREPARATELIGAANLAKAGSATLMLLALAALAAGPLAFPPAALAATLLLGLAYAVGAWAENLGAYFQARERMGVWMQAQAVYGVVAGGLGIALVIATGDLVWFCAAPVVGQVAAVGWLLRRAPRAVRGAWRAPWPLVRGLLRSLLPFAVGFILLSAYYKIDILLVERWRGTVEAGVYAAAYKFVDIAQALALVVATALYPRLSRWAAGPGGHDGRRGAGRQGAGGGRAAEIILFGAVPGAGLLWLLREPLVALLFGAEYGMSAGVLARLAPALPFLVINVLATFVLAAAGRMAVVATLYGAGLALNVGLNALLIPPQGAAGAAVAMLVSEGVVCVALVVALDRLAGSAPGARPVLIAAAAGALVAPLALVPAAAGAAAYVVLVVLLYALSEAVPAGERALLWRAVRP